MRPLEVFLTNLGKSYLDKSHLIEAVSCWDSLSPLVLKSWNHNSAAYKDIL